MAHNPKALLDSYEILPKKSLGQNFMHDPNALEKIVASAEIAAEDVVVEVGAGTGALTDILARAARQVFTIEVDARLQPLLEERFDDRANVYLVFEDILKTNVAALVGADEYIVVANVPYYISSAILWRFLESARPPLRMIMTMQYEVAERVIGAPGAMNLLSIATHFYGKPRMVGKFGPAVFWPRPNIDSAIVRIDTHATPPVQLPSRELFFRVVKAGFSMKRKQLKNSLSGGLQIRSSVSRDLLRAAEIAPQRRAETLSLAEWARLTRTIADEKIGSDERLIAP
jgi:16S rRNA (adenine1518-N6/adenine1519-N6)-dimethyltransferase